MHTNAWAGWVTLVMVVALTTANPFYLGVVLLAVLLVAAVAPRTSRGITSFRAILVFGVIMFAVSGVIGVINGNYGDHHLFTIPGTDLPGWLGGLRLGGPVSAEGMVATMTRGLAILSVLLAFAVFNGVVSPHRVLRSTPAALFQAGLVVTVGLTLLPSTIEDVRRIREMRALRGARGGFRGLPALVVPTVIGGLERSMRLAEAMEARGYGAAPAGPRASRMAGLAAAPLLLLAACGWFYYESLRVPSAGLAAAGVAGLAWWAMASARSRHVTSLSEEPLPAGDRALAWASFGLALLVLALALAGWDGLKYNPFSDLAWPAFALPAALLPLATAWPAIRLTLAPQPTATPARLAPGLNER